MAHTSEALIRGQCSASDHVFELSRFREKRKKFEEEEKEEEEIEEGILNLPDLAMPLNRSKIFNKKLSVLQDPLCVKMLLMSSMFVVTTADHPICMFALCVLK